MTRAEARRALERAALRWAAMVQGQESWRPPNASETVLEARAAVFAASRALYSVTPAEERHG